MSPLEVLDPAALERLREWGGADLLARMIDLFVELGEDRLSQMEAASREGALEQVERAAHSLKSSAGNLGANRLRAVAAELEAAAIARKPAEVKRLFGRIPEVYRTTVEELHRVRPEEAEGMASDEGENDQ